MLKKPDARRLSFMAVVIALASVLIIIAGAFPFLSVAFATLSGAVLFVIGYEYGFKSGFLAFFLTLILTAILAYDKEPVLYFAVLLGEYPGLKGVIETKCPKKTAAQYILKLITFNLAMALIMILAYYFNPFSVEEITKITSNLALVIIVFLGVGNAVFLVYDYALTGFISYYIMKLSAEVRKRIKH